MAHIFWHISGKMAKRTFKFWTFLHAHATFWDSPHYAEIVSESFGAYRPSKVVSITFPKRSCLAPCMGCAQWSSQRSDTSRDIGQNHIAYYLRKDEGVQIPVEVRSPQPQQPNLQGQEDSKVDEVDLYVEAYQWAGQRVSKGKLSSREAAYEVYLRFGISLSHSACAKAAEDEGAPPPRREGRLLLCHLMFRRNLPTSVLHSGV